jgi:hypothetical protein
MTERESENLSSLPAARLADIDELFQAVEREIDQEKPAAYVTSSATADTPDADPAAPYVRAAAVLCTFDPNELKPLDATQSPTLSGEPNIAQQPLHLLLGYSTLVVDSKGRVRSCLRDCVRRTALTELVAAGRVKEALAANPAMTSDKSDVSQQIFNAVLTGSLQPLNMLRLDELTALQLVGPWVEKLEPEISFPPAQEIRRYQERERLLDPFRRLIGRWENGLFVEHFRGRKKELRRLRKYVDVAKSESVLESIDRAGSAAAAYLFNLEASPPLVIYGPGGVGKSTLMAKFLLQHAEAQETKRYPFVYIDFDRPDLTTVDAYTLLAEIARQLAVQYPAAEQSLLHFRHFLQKEKEQGPSGVKDPNFHVLTFHEIYNQYIEPDRPLLFVLDTFEEVQQRSRDDVYQLFSFLDRLQSAINRLRAVLAGRAPVTKEEAGIEPENYPLLDLDEEAAKGFLRSRGVLDDDVTSEIIELAGRHPLALKLAADLVQEQGMGEVRTAAGGTGLIAHFQRAWTRTDITGRLYQRLLNHITDPEARKLAHPGLVLRRITPEIIRKVLAEPCGVEVKDDADAQLLFERLQRQVSLVAPAEPGVLRHRADVRQIMLPLILKDEAGPARRIQKLAVAYYKSQEGTAARAEEIYHRLMLDESPRSVEKSWSEGLKAHLRPSLDELPPRAQAFVAARIGVERPDEIWQEADVEDWELYAEQRIRNLLKKDEPVLALEILRQRPAYSKTSRLHGLEALVHNALGERLEAQYQAESALKLYGKAGLHHDLVQELNALLTKPGKKAAGLYSPEEVKRIADIVSKAHVDYSGNLRLQFFKGIPRDFIASIPITESPASQLYLDLQHLNIHSLLTDGSHPMLLWLKQAVALLKNSSQAKTLQIILKSARRLGDTHAPKRR